MNITTFINRFFCVVLAILSIFLVMPGSIMAADTFFDDFEDISLAGWLEDPVLGDSSGTWYVEDGSLYNDVGPDTSSHLYVGDSFDMCDYTVKSSTINKEGVDQSFMLRVSPDKDTYYLVDYRFQEPNWPQDGNNFRIWKYYSGSYHMLTSKNPSEVGLGSLVQNVSNDIRIVVLGNNIKAYFNDVMVFDYTDTSLPVLECGAVGLRSWGGSYGSVNSYEFFELINNGVVDEKVKKVIILPGLGASWNGDALVYGSDVEDSEWKMTPFVKNYDSLMEYLDEEGVEYEVWNYDWRRPLSEIVESFSEYYSNVTSDDEEVYVVGHSLGGLVARLWYQGLADSENLSGVVTVGSPHLGSVKAYEAYNGGKLSDDSFGVDDIAWNLYLTLKNKGGATRVETIRSVAPILKDLSPTYEFLRNDDGVYPASNSVYFNDFLSSWNSNHLDWSKVKRLVGKGELTKETISLGSRSIYQETLGLWPDGSVIGYSSSDGDGTVTKASASGVGVDVVEVVGGHGELVDKSLSEIADILGTSDSGFSGVSGEYGGSLFYLGSPARLRLACDNFEIDDDSGFIYTEEEVAGCELRVIGEGDGVYHLVTADLEKNDWRYFELETEDGQIDVYKLGEEVGDVDTWYGLLSYYVDRLEEGDSKGSFVSVRRMIKKKDINSIISWVLRYRRIRKEDVYTRLMIGTMENIYSSDKRFKRISWNEKILTYLDKHLSYVEKINQFLLLRGKKPGVFSASSYEWSKEILDNLKQEEWSPLQKYYWSRVLMSLFIEARSS